MEAIYNYITDPNTIVTLIAFIFGVWVAWSNLNWKLKELEKRIWKIEELDLDARLTQIQTDLTRIKAVLDELKQK
jgi:hypothetical protein